MVRALTARETLRLCIDPKETPEDQKTYWLCAPLSQEDDAWVSDQEYLHAGIPIGTAALRLLRKYLRGCDNLLGPKRKDGTSDVVDFERAGDGAYPEGPSEAFLKRIPRDARCMLALALIKASRLDPEDTEKS